MVKRGYGAVLSSGRPFKVRGRSSAMSAMIAARKRRSMQFARQFGNRLPGRLIAARGEVNAVDMPSQVAPLNTTGGVFTLNNIRAGSTYVNRTGRRVEMKNVRVSGFINVVRTVAAPDYIRILVVYDRQTNGSLPLIADILATTDQAAANTTTSLSGANLNNRDRFVILMDYRAVLPSVTDTAGQLSNIGVVDQQQNQFYVERFIPLKGLLTQFKADSSPAVIGDIATGGLFLVTLGQNAAASEGWQFTFETRLRFTDTH